MPPRPRQATGGKKPAGRARSGTAGRRGPILTFSTQHPSALSLNDEAKKLSAKLATTRKRFADFQREQQAKIKKDVARMKREAEQSPYLCFA